MKKITRISLLGIAVASIGLVVISLVNFEGPRSVGENDNATQTPFSVLETYTPEPSQTLRPTKTSTPTITPIVILDPDPLPIDFTADDGQQLSGIYYPADQNPAPLIILMHWAKGNQEEWEDIAVWLQNRVEVDQTPDYNYSWRSGNMFPGNTSPG